MISCVLSQIEKIGLAQMVDWFVIATMALLWFFLPNDGIALVSQWFNNKVIQVGRYYSVERIYL